MLSGEIGRLVLIVIPEASLDMINCSLFSTETFGYHLLESQKEGKFLMSGLSLFFPPCFSEEDSSAPRQQGGQARVTEQAQKHVSTCGGLPHDQLFHLPSLRLHASPVPPSP